PAGVLRLSRPRSGPLPGGPRRAAPPRNQRGAVALGAVARQAHRGRRGVRRAQRRLAIFSGPGRGPHRTDRRSAWGDVRQQGAVARQIGSARMLSAAPSCASMLHHVLLYESAAALSLVVTALIVAGNQRFLPRAVGIPSAIRPSAIA